MRAMLTGLAAAATVVCFSQAGLAQERTLQFDVNNWQFQAMDAAGAPSPFGGTSHTGSLVMTDELPTTELLAILIRTSNGPFQSQPGGPWNLTDANLTINLDSGNVTGGSLLLDVNGGPGGGGDRYSATIGSAGSVTTFVGGGFKVEGLSFGGAFSDATFATVDVTDFFNAQGGQFLEGSFLSFRIQPEANGSGYADADIFVANIPAPGSLALLIGALAVTRRRRR